MKILFQGDSITDAGRDWNNDAQLGRGYAHLVLKGLTSSSFYILSHQTTFVKTNTGNEKKHGIYRALFSLSNVQ